MWNRKIITIRPNFYRVSVTSDVKEKWRSFYSSSVALRFAWRRLRIERAYLVGCINILIKTERVHLSTFLYKKCSNVLVNRCSNNYDRFFSKILKKIITGPMTENLKLSSRPQRPLFGDVDCPNTKKKKSLLLDLRNASAINGCPF